MSSASHYLRRLPPCWRHALAAFLAARLLASAVAAIAMTTIPANPVVPAETYTKPVISVPGELFLGVWERSDALWYLHLARDGYQPAGGSTAFMPLYPACIRALSMVGVPPLQAALLLSNLAFLVALAGLYRLAERDFGPGTARRSLWYQALFPASFFLLAPYTESLYLALAVWALLMAREGRWTVAGALGGLLATTRTVGILVLLPLALEFWLARRRDPGLARWRCLALLLVPLGLGAVMLVQWGATGDPLAFAHAQEGWQRQFLWPWSTFLGGLAQAVQFAGAEHGGIYLFEAGAALYALVLGLATARMPASYGLFTWTVLLVPLASPYAGNLFMSLPRFVAVIFPLHVALAARVRNRDADALVRALMAGLYGLATGLYVASRNMF